MTDRGEAKYLLLACVEPWSASASTAVNLVDRLRMGGWLTCVGMPVRCMDRLVGRIDDQFGVVSCGQLAGHLLPSEAGNGVTTVSLHGGELAC